MSNKTTKIKTTNSHWKPSETFAIQAGTTVTFKQETIPILTLMGSDHNPVMTIHPDGRIKINEVNRMDEIVDIFVTSLCNSLDTRLGGAGYRDAIFQRLQDVCEENGGVLTKEHLTSEQDCVIIEERLKGVR